MFKIFKKGIAVYLILGLILFTPLKSFSEDISDKLGYKKVTKENFGKFNEDALDMIQIIKEDDGSISNWIFKHKIELAEFIGLGIITFLSLGSLSAITGPATAGLSGTTVAGATTCMLANSSAIVAPIALTAGANAVIAIAVGSETLKAGVYLTDDERKQARKIINEEKSNLIGLSVEDALKIVTKKIGEKLIL